MFALPCADLDVFAAIGTGGCVAVRLMGKRPDSGIRLDRIDAWARRCIAFNDRAAFRALKRLRIAVFGNLELGCAGGAVDGGGHEIISIRVLEWVAYYDTQQFALHQVFREFPSRICENPHKVRPRKNCQTARVASSLSEGAPAIRGFNSPSPPGQ